MSDKHACEQPMGFLGRKCGKTASSHEGGRWYCGTHSPERKRVRRAAKYDAWKKGWDAQRAAEEEKRSREAALKSARRAVVEAAKAWRHSAGDPNWENPVSELFGLAKAVDALEKLERPDA